MTAAMTAIIECVAVRPAAQVQDHVFAAVST